MTHGIVRARDSFEAPADAVWSSFQDFGGISKWAGRMIKGCTLEGEGVGAVRTLTFTQGNPLRERLVQFDDADRSFIVNAAIARPSRSENRESSYGGIAE